MTRGQRHEIQVGGVPRRHDDPAILRMVHDLVDALLELVDALSGVVGVHVHVGGTKVPPLEPVHRAQVSHLPVPQPSLIEELARAVPIPNVNVLFGKDVGVCASLQARVSVYQQGCHDGRERPRREAAVQDGHEHKKDVPK